MDFTEIRPEEDDEAEAGALKIDQFRKIKESLGFGAHEGGYRIFLIPDADRMTAQAANSVLKILEEPPEGWIFFLTASDPDSGSSHGSFSLPIAEASPLRHGNPQETSHGLGYRRRKTKTRRRTRRRELGPRARSCLGRISEHRQMLFDFLERPQGALNSLVDWASQNDRNFNLLSDQLELLCLDLIRWSISEQASQSYAWMNFDGAMALKNHVGNLLTYFKHPKKRALLDRPFRTNRTSPAGTHAGESQTSDPGYSDSLAGGLRPSDPSPGSGKEFSGRWIFREISFHVETGRIRRYRRALRAAGKACCSRLIAGLLSPTRAKSSSKPERRHALSEKRALRFLHRARKTCFFH